MNASLIGRIVGLAFLSGMRPFMTITIAQLVVMLGVYAGWVGVRPDYAVLMSWPVVGVFFGLAVLEVVLAHDPDADEVKRLAQLDKVGGVIAAAYGTLLMFAIGEPAPEAVRSLSASSPELAQVLASTTGSQPYSPWVQAAAVAGAATLNFGFTSARAWVLDWLSHVGLHRVWNVIETGGVPLAVLLVLFAPVVLVVLGLLAAALVAVVGIAAHAWQRRLDQLARVDCPHCGRRARVEASVCPHCRQTLTPARWLGQESVAVRGAAEAAG